MLKTAIEDVYHHRIDGAPYCIYVIRDRETVLYVGKAVDICKRLREHIGFDLLGEIIVNNLPQSLNWTMELYNLNDCDTLLSDCYLDVDTAEFDMIAHLKPCLNDIYGRNRSELPERYYDTSKIVNAGIKQSQ